MSWGDVVVNLGAGALGGGIGGGATVWLTKRATTKKVPRVSLEPEVEVAAVAARDHDTAFPSLWIQLIVVNTGGGDTADNVRVTVCEVRDEHARATPVPVSELRWSGTELSAISLDHEARRRVDLAHVLWPPKPAQEGCAPWAPPWPFTADQRTNGALVMGGQPRLEHDGRIVLEPGEYTVELELSASGLTAQRFDVNIELKPLRDAWQHDEHPEALLATPIDAPLPASGPQVLRVLAPRPVAAT